MKYILILFLMPILSFGQIEKAIKLKVAVMQNFVAKGEEGESLFWQIKGRITFGIVNYTEQQNPIFRDLFINQYKELITIYKKMIVSEDEKDTSLFVKTLIRQEQDFRNLLTKEQLKLYLDKLNEFEINNQQAHETYSSLFFSEKLLNEFISKFI